jgi:CBS domain-containing protein
MTTMTAQDLMTTEVVCVPSDMPVLSVVRLVAERGLSSVPVTDRDGRVVGVVTEADLLRRLASAEDRPAGWLRRLFGDQSRQAADYARTHGLTAGDVMTRDLVTAKPDDTAAYCAHLMEQHKIKRLPVLREGRLAGVVSRADLLRAVLTEPPRLGAGADRDGGIRAALRREIRAQPWADSLYMFPEVKDGVVTLYGMYRSEEVRRGMKVLASRIQGVERVEDKLEPAPYPLLGEFV